MENSYHNAQFKGAKIDPYRIFRIYGVTDPAIQHAVKKLLRFGRGNGGKGGRQDVEEAIASLNRWIEMEEEDLQPIRQSVKRARKIFKEQMKNERTHGKDE